MHFCERSAKTSCFYVWLFWPKYPFALWPIEIIGSNGRHGYVLRGQNSEKANMRSAKYCRTPNRWVLQRNCNIVHQLLDKNVLFPFSLFYLGLFGSSLWFMYGMMSIFTGGTLKKRRFCGCGFHTLLCYYVCVAFLLFFTWTTMYYYYWDWLWEWDSVLIFSDIFLLGLFYAKNGKDYYFWLLPIYWR